MSIKVDHLTKIYGKQVAVDAISFDIPTGQVVGFLGPNGAGKSTTMKMITGYIPPTSGKGTVCGIDLVENNIEVRKLVGYLPENNPLYLDMFVKEYLEFVAGLSGIRSIKTAVERAIEMTKLSPERHKKVGQLSKGYRQRVGLAQALIHEPKVLILDEPTSGLDPLQVVEIRQVIKDLGKDQTVLLSTHIMQEVEAMCDRVIMINKGKLVADDMVPNLTKNGTSLEETFRNLANSNNHVEHI